MKSTCPSPLGYIGCVFACTYYLPPNSFSSAHLLPPPSSLDHYSQNKHWSV